MMRYFPSLFHRNGNRFQKGGKAQAEIMKHFSLDPKAAAPTLWVQEGGSAPQLAPVLSEFRSERVVFRADPSWEESWRV